MRVVFMGSPDFAVPTLYALIAAGHEVAAAYCQPPRPAGRGKSMQPTPVQRAAELLGIPVLSPASLKNADQQEHFAALRADAGVVAAYGLILPQAVLDAPKLGCLNVHASLLPRWRGAAPVQRAILAGDTVTGVTIMQMEAGLDTGPMLAAQEVAVNRKTAGQLTAELAMVGAQLMVQVLSSFKSYPHVAQDDDSATYAPKVRKEEARIDWRRSAAEVERQVRAFNPLPGAFFEHQGERIRVLEAGIEDGQAAPGTVIDEALGIGCAESILRPLKVQRAGRGAMSAGELLRGFPIAVGTILP